jgi:hypothetical protein
MVFMLLKRKCGRISACSALIRACADRECAQQERPVLLTDDDEIWKQLRQLKRDFSERETQRFEHDKAQHERPGLAGALELFAEQAHDHRAEHGEPEYEQ